MADPLQLVGTTLEDKYVIESVVGEGGYAVVYRAQHLIWKRPVAIKVFKAVDGLTEKHREQLLNEFVREGKLLAELSERSTAICQARDIGTMTTPSGAWAPYMVLEWLDGPSLERVIREEQMSGLRPRTPLQALELLESVAEALAIAHGMGVAHRDVKPDNILVLGDPRGDAFTVKLLDFGIAKVVQDAQKRAGAFSKTQGQITSFTPAYGAPEQFSRAHGATGPWTDVHALALVFGELVSGKEPLEGDDLTQLSVASTNRLHRPTPRALGAHVPDEVEVVLARALAVSTDERYQSAGEFWNALRRAMWMPTVWSSSGHGWPTSAARAAFASSPDTADRSSSGAALLARKSSPEEAAFRATTTAEPLRGVKTRRLLAFGGVLLASVIGAAGFLASRGDRGHAANSAAVAPLAVTLAAKAVVAKPPACAEDMILIPGGKFFMGSDDKADLEFERPAHQVTLAPFCMDRHEVTVSRYKACSDMGECKRAPRINDWEGITASEKTAFDPLCNARDPEGRAKHPINCIDWDMAEAFCKSAVPSGHLPTEAEWEFAARGPDGRRFPWGDELPDARHLNGCGPECVAWGKSTGVAETAMYETDDGFATTAPVGSFPAGASRYGVEDVVGNVWEWTSDWYAPYASDSAVDPQGPASETSARGKVIRGGAWNGAYPAWVRPTFRYHDAPSKRSYGIGFRCAAAPASIPPDANP